MASSLADYILTCKERACCHAFDLTNKINQEDYYDISPCHSGPVVGYKKRKITLCDE